MWKEHYESILNSFMSDQHRDHFMDHINCEAEIVSDPVSIRPCQVKDALKDLKHGKSCGHDGLAAEHFKFADDSICVYLSMLYSSMLTHGHLPVDFMKSVIVPIVKVKTGDSSDKGNYRPIALVTACSKLFEVILLDIIDSCLDTCDNQFGFKRKHGTDLCIFTLKNVVQYYRDRNSPVYSCFLDASKAFDRVTTGLYL
jgi:hypothetical protein